MGGAAFPKVSARLIEAERPIHGQPHLRRVCIFLAVVFPPANRAQLQAFRSSQRPESAAGAAIEGFHAQHIHARMDGFRRPLMTKRRTEHAFLIGCAPVAGQADSPIEPVPAIDGAACQ